MENIMKTAKDVLKYVKSAIATFDNDPPDSPFQRGYLAALEETKAVIEAGLISQAEIVENATEKHDSA